MAWSPTPGANDVLAGALIGLVFGAIGYVAIKGVNLGADSGVLWHGLLRKEKRRP